MTVSKHRSGIYKKNGTKMLIFFSEIYEEIGTKSLVGSENKRKVLNFLCLYLD